MRKGDRGFTLTELLVATAVFSVVMTICLAGFVALQRFQSVCLARSGLRTEIIRLFDSLEMDLRAARMVSAPVSGNENVLPLTLTIPQRYTAYETTGNLSGDPARTATRVQPTVNTTTGKVEFSADITVRYEAVAKGTTASDIKRTVTWVQSGAQQTASRVVATVPKTATVRFRSSGSTSASPSPVAASDIALIAKVTSPLSTARSASAAPTTMESTILLRRKLMK
jgi:prepilin-type N-terminal cleavage/methylation domain-containing protein